MLPQFSNILSQSWAGLRGMLGSPPVFKVAGDSSLLCLLRADESERWKREPEVGARGVG